MIVLLPKLDFLFTNIIGKASKTINVNGFESIIYRVQQILKSQCSLESKKVVGVIF